MTRGAGLRIHGDSHAASPRPSVPSLGPGRAVSAATSEHLSQRPAVPGPGGAAVLACVSHRHVPLGCEGALSCDRRSAGKGVLGVPRPWALRSVATRPWSPRWRHSWTRPADAHTGCPVPGRHRRVGAREQRGAELCSLPRGGAREVLPGEGTFESGLEIKVHQIDEVAGNDLQAEETDWVEAQRSGRAGRPGSSEDGRAAGKRGSW